MGDASWRRERLPGLDSQKDSAMPMKLQRSTITQTEEFLIAELVYSETPVEIDPNMIGVLIRLKVAPQEFPFLKDCQLDALRKVHTLIDEEIRKLELIIEQNR